MTADRNADPVERFSRMLRACVGKERAVALAREFLADAGTDFPRNVGPTIAARLCLRLASLGDGDATFDLRPALATSDSRFELVGYGSPFERPLDEIIPMLRNLGLRILDQIAYRVRFRGSQRLVRSFAIGLPGRVAERRDVLRRKLADPLTRLISGRLPDDPLNALIVDAGLQWPQVAVLRAYRDYAGQLGGSPRRSALERALVARPSVAALLIAYFESRFDPSVPIADTYQREIELLEPLRSDLGTALSDVTDPADDHALREIFNLIDATLRTNYYTRAGGAESPLSLKLDAGGVIDMPGPRPASEIYVHAPDLEGIHLRAGPVARGGIRWSTRAEDLRREILGLQQTQTLKNALIVPSGAKGGFVLRGRPGHASPSSEADGQAGYRRFIQALLDVIDRDADGGRAGQPATVAYDGPDRYLVVAADKGTAGYSDIANELSNSNAYWLGDAFASGGTHGFDHKQLGITARGAWECVRWHFRELGRDIDIESISVVGIGTMDGDVFGNGMLVHPGIRLLAAFGSRHVFLDPDPDTAVAYRERQRLFRMRRSSWDDYDRSLISSGGGVFDRTAKRIALNPAIRSWLGVHHETVDAEYLIRLLLSAPVDLLWLGGIGTFVRSSAEVDEQVGDHANDRIRIDATQLNAAVVAEGANLGFTPRARIEYALQGGRINADAVDNSAGVDLSDHEVNLKILLDRLLAAGVLADRDQRNALLREVRPDVCDAVLADNRGQALALSLDVLRCRRDPEPFLRVAEHFRQLGLLDPDGVTVAGRAEVLARRDRALTRPELAILLAQAKLALKAAVRDVGIDALHSSDADGLFHGYFPSRFRSMLPDRQAHPLADDIVACCFSNEVLNRLGSSLLAWVEPGEPLPLLRAARCYRFFDRALAADALRERLQRARSLSGQSLLAALLTIEDGLQAISRWALARGLNPQEQELGEWAELWVDYRTAIDAFPRHHSSPATGSDWLITSGLDDADAHAIAAFAACPAFGYVASLRRGSGVPLDRCLWLYRTVAERLGWSVVSAWFDAHPSADHVHRMAREAIRASLQQAFALLAARVATGTPATVDQLIDGLRREGRLTQLAWIRHELAAAAPTRALEMLVVWTADVVSAVERHAAGDLPASS
ncbi:MAG: NAD-glutamate dehydrogenase [Methylotetracoccus sp.]